MTEVTLRAADSLNSGSPAKSAAFISWNIPVLQANNKRRLYGGTRERDIRNLLQSSRRWAHIWVWENNLLRYEDQPAQSPRRRLIRPSIRRVNGSVQLWWETRPLADGQKVDTADEKKKGEKQQSQEGKNKGIREIHHHPTSVTLRRAWPYQAAGLSERRNQVAGKAARPAPVWEHGQLGLHQPSGRNIAAIPPFFFLPRTAQWRCGCNGK